MGIEALLGRCAAGRVTVSEAGLWGCRKVHKNLDGTPPRIKQLVKHRSWSYENEVRLVATISKLDLEGKASRIKSIKIPLNLDH